MPQKNSGWDQKCYSVLVRFLAWTSILIVMYVLLYFSWFGPACKYCSRAVAQLRVGSHPHMAFFTLTSDAFSKIFMYIVIYIVYSCSLSLLYQYIQVLKQICLVVSLGHKFVLKIV
jgi:hypothetical protein